MNQEAVLALIYLAVIAVVCAFVAFLTLAVKNAHSHEYEHPELTDWYRTLRSGIDKTPCCDGDEAMHVADVDWDTTCENNNFGESHCHFRVHLYDRWWDVPASAVVPGPNKSGAALVWDVPTRKDNTVISTFIRCFMPGSGM